MGYKLNIVRDGGDDNYHISIQEFKNACDSIQGFSINDSGDVAQYTDSMHGTFIVFWSQGETWTENPQDWVIPIIVSLAEKLNGRVRGEEGESYNESGQSYIHQDDKKVHDLWEERRIRLINRAKFWNYLKIIVMIGVLLVVIYRISS